MPNRGIILPLSQQQRVTRALYLAGRVPLSALDEHIRRDAATLAAMTGYEQRLLDGSWAAIGAGLRLGINAPAELDLDRVYCPPLYYRLPYPNGGTDPTAPDPAARVPHPNVTARVLDCSAGGWWCQGIDRFVIGLEIEGYKDLVGRLVGSWLNTDSCILGAQLGLRNPGLRFLDEPEPGCVMTCESGSPGHKVGHQATVTAYRGPRWDPTSRACWEAIEAVDCADRRDREGAPVRTNALTTGRGWFGTGARFIRVEMAPSAGLPA